MDFLGWLDGLRSSLAAITTNEARVVASAVVLIGAVIVGNVAVPLLIRGSRRALSRRVVRGPVQTWIDASRRHVPWTLSLVFFIRFLQVTVALVTILALLVIWGRLDLAALLVTSFVIAAPNFVRLVLSVSLAAGAFVGTSLLQGQIRRFGNRTDRLTQHQEEVAYRILQITTFILVGLVILGLWNVDLSGLLVGAGFLGIVLGMAARQTLGSAIAGFVLMFARPFEIGDWVLIGDHEGIVTDISINNTRLENFDGEYVVISNDRVSDDVIINRTRKGRLRVRLEVGVDYATDLDHAEATILETVKEIDEVMTVPAPQVVPTKFGDSAVVLEMRFWVDKPSARRRWRAIAEIIRAVKKAFDREGITIPFPQRELSGRAETSGFEVVSDRDEPTGFESPRDGGEPRSPR